VTPAEKAKRIRDLLGYAIDEAPGAAEKLGAVAAQILNARDAYERSHWGRRGVEPTIEADLPHAESGLVVLGELVSIVYRAEKGDTGMRDYSHPFRAALPVLCYAADGSGLIIVRGPSRYTVGVRGIVG
jgi:hypothetical protein